MIIRARTLNYELLVLYLDLDMIVLTIICLYELKYIQMFFAKNLHPLEFEKIYAKEHISAIVYNSIY